MESEIERKSIIQKQFTSDISFWALLISNFIVIVWAVLKKWTLPEIVWIYWVQSVGIGFFWYRRILSLKEFSTKNFSFFTLYDGENPVTETVEDKEKAAKFFVRVYGISLLIYALAIIAFLKTFLTLSLILAGLVFLCEQTFSFHYKKDQPAQHKPNLGKMFICPCFRLLTAPALVLLGEATKDGEIIFDQDSVFVLVVFLLLKTVADIVIYSFEERGFADDTALDTNEDTPPT